MHLYLRNPHIIIAYTIIACIALYITENLYHPTYVIQISQKLLSFIIVPLIWGYLAGVRIGRFGEFSRRDLALSVGLGLTSMIVITLVYLGLRENIDWQAIQTSIAQRGVTQSTFILVFAYIMLGNSLVEEYFFRGIVFYQLIERHPWSAYILSSLMFSLYHISIFGTWFRGPILALALFGLFVGGLFFAWLYRRTGGIWGAWIFHIFADLVILVIGYQELFI